jgi:hypothetical protein
MTTDEPGTRGSTAEVEPLAELLDAHRVEELRARWSDLQRRFVDDPESIVAEADALVAEVMQELDARFGDVRASLEAQWGRGEEASTEDLRVALQRYRSFFERLLST